MANAEGDCWEHPPRNESQNGNSNIPTMNFHHEPLRNSTAYIRLLKLVETATNDMNFELHAWQTDNAPKYNAISYTWGEQITRPINVNDQVLQIRSNCYEALQQAVRYDSKSCLWIDSICIDQENLAEKSDQVHGMYKIYRSATHVLACAGGHADGSELLLQYCGRILGPEVNQMLSQGVPSTENPELDIPEIAMAFAKRTPRDTLAQVRRITAAFAHRPYWNRLWIVQEILAGSKSLRVLFGNDSLSWRQFSAMVDVMLLLTPSSSKEKGLRQTPLGKLIHVKEMCDFYGGTVRLSQLLKELSETGCTDPRDRIFGLVAIVDWKSMDLAPIVPDYERTSWSLAIELILTLGPQSCSSVMSMLEIDGQTPEMQALIRQRGSSGFARNNADRTQDFDVGEVTVIQLFEDGCRHLRVDDYVDTRPDSEEDDAFAESFKRLLSFNGGLDDEIHARKPRKVWYDVRAVALVCGDTLPGDFLIASLAWKRMCLICRPAQGHDLDVVGTGIVLTKMNGARSDFALSDSKSSEATNGIESTSQTNLQISTTPEDVMLFSQMVTICEKEWEQDSVELRNMMLGSALAQRGAARLVVRNH